MTKGRTRFERDREDREGRASGETPPAAPAEQTPLPSSGEEAPGPEAGVGAGAGEDPLARAEQECAGLKDRLLRLQAEFENYRKRQARERQDQQRAAGERFAGEVLPVLDNLERAVDHAGDADAATLLEGVKMVLRQLREVLEGFGVEPIAALGEAFDPHCHEAMSRVETEGDPPDGTVVEEYRKGYMLQGKVLRPAMVAVAKIVDELSGEVGD